MHPMLSLEEKAMLAEKHAKKSADAQRRGISVILRDIMIHKVSPKHGWPQLGWQGHRFGVCSQAGGGHTLAAGGD